MKIEDTPEWKAIEAKHALEREQLGPKPGRGQVNSLGVKHEIAEVELRHSLHMKLQREGKVTYSTHKDGTHEFYCGELLVQVRADSGAISTFVFKPYGGEYHPLHSLLLKDARNGINPNGMPALNKALAMADRKSAEIRGSQGTTSKPTQLARERSLHPAEQRAHCPYCKAPRGRKCVVAGTARIKEEPHFARYTEAKMPHP